MPHAISRFDDPSVTARFDYDADDGRKYVHLVTNGNRSGTSSSTMTTSSRISKPRLIRSGTCG
jgi:hypothetical protein